MLKKQFEINGGIKEPHLQQIVNGLANLLADNYTLYIQTQNFHWNITGPLFNSLHSMFELQYIDLANANDLIAERIRALGFIAPGSYKEFASLTKIEGSTGDITAIDMLKKLINSNEILIQTARKILPIAEEAHDEVTVDLITGRLQIHEKNVWMMRSMAS